MANKTSTDVYMLALVHMVENSASVNFMMGTSKRVKQMLRQKKNKSSTDLEKERIKASSRKRNMCPSLSAITIGRRCKTQEKFNFSEKGENGNLPQ